MNVSEYRDIVNSFLPEIILIVGALLVLGLDLFLGKRNMRKALVMLAVLISLFAAGTAFWQWGRTDLTGKPYVQNAVRAMLTGHGDVAPEKVFSEDEARTVIAVYKQERHDAVKDAVSFTEAHKGEPAGSYTQPTGTDKPAYDAGLANPAFNVWWFFRMDQFALMFKAIFALALALTLLLSTRFPVGRYRGEFAALLMFAAVGLMVMASGLDLVIIFLGLEVASLCFYALAAWNKDDAKSAEAGTKYLLLGSLASAFIIYGASLFFVQYGSTHINVLTSSAAHFAPLTIVALFMVLVGFIFKVAGAPLHLWAPDVYQGAPTAMVAFLSTASKAAGFAVLVRVLFSLTQGQPEYAHYWTLAIGVVAGLSILVGNLVAIHQNNVKRMLAYSGIAQAGYILIGLLAMGHIMNGGEGNLGLAVTAVVFYVFLYMVTNIGAFGVVGIVGSETGSEEMSAFAGLRDRAPVLAFGMTLLLLSLGGIPMLSGFVGKWYLFLSGIYENQYLLVLIGTTMSVVSMYYYLLVVKQMYILPAKEGAKPIRVGALASIAVAVTVLVTVAIGLYPGPLYNLMQVAAKSLTGQQ